MRKAANCLTVLAICALLFFAGSPASADPGPNGNGKPGHEASGPGPHSNSGHGDSGTPGNSGHGDKGKPSGGPDATSTGGPSAHGNAGGGKPPDDMSGKSSGPAQNSPPGNNGTIKVHKNGVEGDVELRRNMPHVSCSFHLYGFHFDEAQSGSWKIVAWSPGGDHQTVAASGNWHATADGDWRSGNIVLAEGHYKLFYGTFGGHEKMKVFWVDGCGTPVGKLHKITVSPSSATIVLGASQTFTATGFDKLGNEISITPTWSTNSTTASCNSSGSCTATAPGRFTITATSGEVSGTATLNVTATATVLATITVVPASATIALGGSQTFTARGFDMAGNEMSITPTWSINSTSASCDSGGTCTSDTAGRFIVSATSGEIVGTATLHVTAAVLARITVTPPFAAIALGSSQTFTATGFDTLNNEVSITPTWSASTSAGCGSSGTCTPTATGTFTVSATSGEIVGTATLNVTEAAATLARITVTPPFAAIALGSSQTFTATGFDTLNNEVSITPTWSASSVSAGCGSSGTCTPSATGTFTVSATSGEIVGTATLNVNASGTGTGGPETTGGIATVGETERPGVATTGGSGGTGGTGGNTLSTQIVCVSNALLEVIFNGATLLSRTPMGVACGTTTGAGGTGNAGNSGNNSNAVAGQESGPTGALPAQVMAPLGQALANIANLPSTATGSGEPIGIGVAGLALIAAGLILLRRRHATMR